MFKLKQGEVPPHCLKPNVSCGLAQVAETSSRWCKAQVGVTPRPHDAPRGTGRALVRRGLSVHSARELPSQGRHSWEKRHLREVGKLTTLMGQGTQCQ